MITVDKVILNSILYWFNSSLERCSSSLMVKAIENTNRVHLHTYGYACPTFRTPLKVKGLRPKVVRINLIKMASCMDARITSKPKGGENVLGQVMFLFFSPGYFQGFLSGSATF